MKNLLLFTVVLSTMHVFGIEKDQFVEMKEYYQRLVLLASGTQSLLNHINCCGATRIDYSVADIEETTKQLVRAEEIISRLRPLMEEFENNPRLR